MDLLNAVCMKCRTSFRREMLFALMSDLGDAELSWDPSECPEGGEHEWREREPKAQTPVNAEGSVPS